MPFNFITGYTNDDSALPLDTTTPTQFTDYPRVFTQLDWDVLLDSDIATVMPVDFHTNVPF